MTRAIDPSRALQKASALRALCLSLPHVPTPTEVVRLRRFEELVARPESATEADIEALAAGWRRWWCEGVVTHLHLMAVRVPPALVDADRRLATYASAAAYRAGT